MKMKKVIWMAMILPLLAIWGFAPKGEISLEGVWLMKTQKHGDGATVKTNVETVKKKILTDRHFTWVEYSKEGELLAMAGGIYKLENGTYTETIEFIFPKGSSLLGNSIPFSYTIEGKKWTHKGFLQYRQINSETGLYDVSKTEKLEEVWERLE